MPDYSEVMAALDRRIGGPTEGSLTALTTHARGSRMVALKLEELLQSDAWNTFLAHAKALLEQDEAERDTLHGQLDAGGLAPDELFKLHNRLQRILGRIERAEQYLALPRQVIQQDEQFQAHYRKSIDNEAGKLVPK